MGNPIEATAPPPASAPVMEHSYAAQPPPPSYAAAQGPPPVESMYPKVNQPPPSGAYGQPPPPSGAYGQPPQPYTAGAHVQQQVVVNAQPVRPNFFGQNQQRMNCTFCNSDIVTSTRTDCGTGSWVICLALCLFVTPCCMCWPACCDSCRDTVHQCPQCKRDVGRRNIM